MVFLTGVPTREGVTRSWFLAMAALLIVVLSLLVGAGQMKIKTWVQTPDRHRLLKRESVTVSGFLAPLGLVTA